MLYGRSSFFARLACLVDSSSLTSQEEESGEAG